MKRGCPTGAAMPLCWSHAEYISLVRSRHDGVCFDRVEPAFQRYVLQSGAERLRDLESAPSPAARISRKNFADHSCRGSNGRLVNRRLGAHQSAGRNSSERTESLVRRFSNRRMAGRFRCLPLHSFGNAISVGKAVIGR